MKINKLLTKKNFDKGNNRKIEYIVIHYVGAEGGAEDNCKYFQNAYRGASAHYFVGHSGEIWQCVEDANIAWHCGALVYKHKYCRNNNSIGVELCCKQSGGKWYFEDKTVAAAVELVKELMKKYGIAADKVIRHYDVSGKQCPAPFVLNNTKHTWTTFKNALTATTTTPAATTTAKAAIKAGDLVKISSNGKYYTGTAIPSWVKKLNWYVNSVAGDRAVLGKSEDGKYNIVSPVSTAFLSVVKTTTTAAKKKSLQTIANEVIAGLWGNGTTRKKKLAAAGYTSAEISKIQELVNAYYA